MITTEQLAAMSSEQLFDYIANHLLTQKAKARDKEGACRYRSDKGLMCAVGCIIPESSYGYYMENSSISDMWLRSIELHGNNVLVKKIRENRAMLCDLQNIHDNHAVQEWEQQLALMRMCYFPITV